MLLIGITNFLCYCKLRSLLGINTSCLLLRVALLVVKIELTLIIILQNSGRNVSGREILPFSFLFYLNGAFKIPDIELEKLIKIEVSKSIAYCQEMEKAAAEARHLISSGNCREYMNLSGVL